MHPRDEKLCPVCSSQQIIKFIHEIFDSDTTDVLECRNCGLQFLDPVMSEQEEEAYYTDYYEKQKRRHYETMSLKDIQQRALRHYEQYLNIYLELIQSKEEILEIGSGSGGFLQFVINHVPDARITSVERSDANRNFLNDLTVNSFSDICFYDDVSGIEGKTFDAVVALGVFEHVRDSIGFLLNMRKLLKNSSSQLIMNVPNKKNPLIYIYKLDEFKKFSYMKQHYYTFTEKSMRILAECTGFRVEIFNYIQVWSLDNHLSWLMHKQPRDFSDLSAILSSDTLKSYNNDLISRKMTDIMMVVLKPKT